MNTRNWLAATSVCLLLGAAAVQAQQLGQPPSAAATAGHLVVGTVRSVDASSRTLLIAHQAIESLNMGAMTMPFRLADGVPMPDVKAGDSIAFVLAQGSQGLAVTSVKKVAVAARNSGSMEMSPERGMAPGMHHGMGESGSMMAMMEQCQQMMNRK